MIHRVACLISLLVLAGALLAQSEKSTETDSVSTKARRIVAKVNDAELLEAEVDARLRQLTKTENTSVARLRRKLMIEALIQQQLVLEYLDRRSLGATEEEVDSAYRKWEEQLAVRSRDADEYFRRTGMDAEAIRRRFAWQIGWNRFVKRKLSASTLQKYFSDHQTEFDGTRLRVAHILWKAVSASDGSDLMEEVTQVREDIASGKMTFAEAARQHSQAPTADEGGEVGWIERNKPMHPEFSRAAFKLEVDGLSQPVETSHGVHLIKCLEVKPGQRELNEVLASVKRAATNDMFQTLASRERRRAKIRKAKSSD